MKNLKLILVLICIFFATVINANVRTVDNNPGAPNDGIHNFSNLSDAYNACVSGDTLYVQSSPSNYGNLDIYNISKFTLMGPGFNPEYGVLPASLVTINIMTNTDSVYIQGLVINDLNVTGNPSNLSRLLLVERCKIIYRIYTIGTDNLPKTFINGNVFTAENGTFGIDLGNPASNGVIVSNNILNCTITISGSFNIVKNNIFLGTSGAFWIFNNSTVINNIFFRSTPSGGFFSNNVFSNNMVFQCANSDAIPIGGNGNTGTNNIQGLDPGFGGGFPATGDFYNTSYDFHPTATQAVTGSTTGGMLGVYDGSYNFNKYGEPPIPVIKINSNSLSIPQGGTYNINISSKIVH